MRYELRSLSRLIHSPKKYQAVVYDSKTQDIHTIRFGQANASDYTIHGDYHRMLRYISRHRARENWSNPLTAGWWSRYLLWSQPNMEDALKYTLRKLASYD